MPMSGGKKRDRDKGISERESEKEEEKILSHYFFFKKSVSLAFHSASPKRFRWSWSAQCCQFSHDF